MSVDLEKLKAEVAEKMKGVEAALDAPILDELMSSGVSLRIGDRLIKFEFTGQTILPEAEIRSELAKMATAKMAQVRDIANQKASEMLQAVEMAKRHFEKEEASLRERLREANLMPDINYGHAQAGLSVIKGNPNYREKDTLTWLYQGVYWPKKVDGQNLDPKFTKKLMTPVTIQIVTVGDTVRHVSVRQTMTLRKFSHYHGMGDDSDCWGEWKPAKNWKRPDDILSIGRKACAILENINSHSPANRSPRDLPRLETVMNHIIREGGSRGEVKVEPTRDMERMGATAPERAEGERRSVWEVR